MDFLEFAFESDFLKNIQSEVRSLSSAQSSVLILGDSGTGKTSWAHVIGRLGGIPIVFESHEVPKTIKGWKEISHNWDKCPIILEDIDKWCYATQSSFAQFVREHKRQFKRIIATASTRIIAKVREDHFRSDVYYTLAIRKIELPKIGDCLSDFEKIVQFWIKVHSLISGVTQAELSFSAIQKMRSHRWPGNFTELVNVLERALSFSQGQISDQHIKFDDWSHDYSELEVGLTLATLEKKLIMQTLHLTAQNKSQAARMLGISIRTLRNKLNEYRQEVTHELF